MNILLKFFEVFDSESTDALFCFFTVCTVLWIEWLLLTFYKFFLVVYTVYLKGFIFLLFWVFSERLDGTFSQLVFVWIVKSRNMEQRVEKNCVIFIFWFLIIICFFPLLFLNAIRSTEWYTWMKWEHFFCLFNSSANHLIIYLFNNHPSLINKYY